MSYEIVRAISIKNDKVMIKSDSNNVFPKHYTWWEAKTLSEMLKNEGEEEVIKEILLQYWNGNFQKTGNMFDKSVTVMTDWKKYNWDFISYGAPEAERKAKIDEVKDHLYRNYLKAKNRKTGKFYVKKENWFVTRRTSRRVFGNYNIKRAKVFRSELDAEYYMRNYTDYEVIGL